MTTTQTGPMQPDPLQIAPHLPIRAEYLLALLESYYTALLGIAETVLDQPTSAQFYADAGALLNRISDRLLVGAAADNPGLANRIATPTDWLTTVMAPTTVGAYATWGATFASLARYGNIGVLGGSRTSDAERQPAGTLGYTPASIGVASWAIDDDTSSPRTTTAYAYYGEAWRMPGVGYQPCFVAEYEGVNFGPNNQASSPFHINCGGGVYGIQIGAGGGQAAAAVAPCESGITFVNNPTTWNAGITFAATALTGCDGTQGFGSALQLATFQAIEWRTQETVGNLQGSQSGGYLRSVVTLSAQAPRIEFQNGQHWFGNAAGQTTFLLSAPAGVTNYLEVQPGVGQQAAGLYAIKGPNGSANLALYPANAGSAQVGEIQTAGPVVTPGNTIPGGITPANGWLKINVNNQDMRLPLFSPAQAGG